MIEVRIDTSELRELYALIGRNIAGTPCEPANRAPSAHPATGGAVSSPREAGATAPEAAGPRPPLAAEEAGPDRSLVSHSPIFTLAGLRPPAPGPLPLSAAPPAAAADPDTAGRTLPDEGERAVSPGGRDGTSPTASARPSAALQTAPVRHVAAVPREAPALARTGEADDAARRSDVPASAHTRVPSSADGRTEAFRPHAAGSPPSPAESPASAPLRSPAAQASPFLSPTSPAVGPDGSAAPRFASGGTSVAGADPARAWAQEAMGTAASQARAEADGRAPDAPHLAREVEAFLQSAGWADGPSAGQPERAGVIASFILNAAMIPGWPPPRPIEPAAFSRQIALPAVGAALASDEMEAGLLMLKALRDPAVVAALLAALATQRRRRRILAILALLTTNLRALLRLWADEIAALPPIAERNVPTRERLALR